MSFKRRSVSRNASSIATGAPALPRCMAVSLAPSQLPRLRLPTFQPSFPLPLESPFAKRNIAQRALARNLWHSGSVECLRVLRELAHGVTKPATRVELLLDLAEAAGDYDEDETVIDATNAAEQLADEVLGASASDRAAFLLGRIAHARGRRDASISDTAAHFDQAVSLLRRSLREGPVVARDALRARRRAQQYGGSALLQGRHPGSPSRCLRGELADRGLLARLAPESVGDAGRQSDSRCFLWGPHLGRYRVDRLLALASDRFRLVLDGYHAGSVLVGLNSVRGDYEEAIRWHDRISSSVLDGARPNDRALLAIQAAHAYTMSGRAQQALSLLAYVKPGAGCPPWEAPYWHTEAGAALERLDQNTAALAEARKALDGYDALGAHRGKGSAHPDHGHLLREAWERARCARAHRRSGAAHRTLRQPISAIVDAHRQSGHPCRQDTACRSHRVCATAAKLVVTGRDLLATRIGARAQRGLALQSWPLALGFRKTSLRGQLCDDALCLGHSAVAKVG